MFRERNEGRKKGRTYGNKHLILSKNFTVFKNKRMLSSEVRQQREL